MLDKLVNAFKRPPDFVLGSADAPYLRRWWVIPRNRFFNIYLHHFLRSDDDRALHDHPWASCSIILRGGYWEHLPDGGAQQRKPWRVTLRTARAAHRIELHKTMVVDAGNASIFTFRRVEEKPAWTLFFTGPKVREWGFLCPGGWTHWRDFVGVKQGEARGDERGPGCGE